MTEILRPLLRAEDSVPKGSKSAPTTTDHQANQDLFGYGVGLHEVAARKFAQDLVALLGDNGGFFSRDTHELEIDPIQFATYKVTSTREFIEGWYSTLSYKFKVDRVHLETLLGHSGGYYSSYGDTPEFDPVRLATDRLARIRETSSGNIARFYPHPSHGLGFYLDEGNPNYVFVIDPYEVTTYTRSKEISTGSAAGYYPTPGYGLEAGLVVPVKTVVFNYSVDHSSVPSHKLDAGLVKSITAFASVQETSYELDVSLEKPITNALAWIEGGIDTVGKIVSLFHWAYKQASAIVGGKAIASENSELFFVDPNDTVLSQLLAVINIGEDLVNKGIDYWIGVKTSPHEELALVYPEV